MNREKNIQLGVLNIVQHPHSYEKYIELFEEIAENAKATKIFGQYYGIINKLEVHKEDGYIFCKFFRYTNINQNTPWLDLNEKSQLINEEGEAIQQVDEHIKPNSKEIYFYFLIKNHRVVFDSKYISPGSIKQFLENLIKNTSFSEIIKENINITIEQSAESLEEIFNMFSINKIDLLINRPNPDDLAESLENDMKERLENMEANELQQIITSNGGTLKPDETLKAYMTVARSNGRVKVRGKDTTGKTINESTESHPLEVKMSYNENEETYLEAFKNRAFMVVSQIMSGFRGN